MPADERRQSADGDHRRRVRGLRVVSEIRSASSRLMRAWSVEFQEIGPMGPIGPMGKNSLGCFLCWNRVLPRDSMGVVVCVIHYLGCASSGRFLAHQPFAAWLKAFRYRIRRREESRPMRASNLSLFARRCLQTYLPVARCFEISGARHAFRVKWKSPAACSWPLSASASCSAFA